MYDKFTDRSRKVMQLAAKTAKQHGDFYLEAHHLLIALIEEGSGVAANVLKRLDIDVKSINGETLLSEPACDMQGMTYNICGDANTEKVLHHAKEIACALGHNYVGTEHLLLGLLKTEHPVVTKVLKKVGADYDKTYNTITSLLSDKKKTPSKEEIAVNFYCGVLKRIMKICEENSDDKGAKEIRKIAKRAILDGGKWNIS